MQHCERAGARPLPLPCPALPSKFFRSLKDNLFSRGQSAAHGAQGGEKAAQRRREAAGRFLGGCLEKQTRRAHIKLQYPQLFAPISGENKTVSGASGHLWRFNQKAY